jgi:thiosulfate reductase / polysulfide reductase chain A
MTKNPANVSEANMNLRPGEKIIPTFCHGCGAAKPKCSVLCHVVDGRFTRVEGNPEAFNNWGKDCTSLCAKGNTGPQFLSAGNRLLYPLKRIGAKGEGKFQRISWDEALETIADKLKENKAKYGAESYGVLSPEFWPVLDTLGRRFLNLYGSPNYLHSAICATPKMAACRTTIGFNTLVPDDWNKSRLIVNWGANPENSGVNTGNPQAILNAQRNGTKIIDIRPMLDPLASKADLWLPVRPGTDCALALAVLNVLINEKLYDAEFVENWCYGFDKLAEHVQSHTPEWAGKVTGVPAEKIRLAARQIGTIKPLFIKIGNGVGDQTTDGTATISAICLISAITGNLDVPGGQLAGIPDVGPSLIQINQISKLFEKAPPDLVDKLVAPEAPRWFQKMSGLMPHGPTSAYYKALMSILTGKPYPLRSLNASCSNPLSATRNPKKVAEALKKLDFMFAADVYQASHIDYADIVLPVCTSYEHSDQICVKNVKEGTWIGIYNKIIEPLGESRSDWQIYLDLGVKMGYGEYFWQGSMDDCLREQLAPSGISLEELRASPRGIFIKRTHDSQPQYRRYANLFKDLPHGKVQCYNEFIGGKDSCEGDVKLSYFPVYQGPPEGIAETPDLVKEYPFALSDVHAHRFSQHSYMHDVPFLREQQPYPWLKINPAAAVKYGIGDGDWVRVESPHGWCKFKAEYFEGISPEVLMTKRGWWQECVELSLPGYGVFDGGSEVNNLYTGDENFFNKFHSQMPKQTLVKISRIEEGQL